MFDISINEHTIIFQKSSSVKIGGPYSTMAEIFLKRAKSSLKELVKHVSHPVFFFLHYSLIKAVKGSIKGEHFGELQKYGFSLG